MEPSVLDIWDCPFVGRYPVIENTVEDEGGVAGLVFQDLWVAF